MNEASVGRPDFKARILVVEDDTSMGKVIRFNLEEEGHEVTLARRGDRAIDLLQPATGEENGTAPFDLVITDIKLPGANGMEVFRTSRANYPDLPVVLVTAFGSVDSAIEAMTQGAADYITKPFRRQELKARIASSLVRVALERENRELKRPVRESTIAQFLTASPRMQAVLDVVDKVAPTRSTVLLLGESGTGKELVARLLHTGSDRSAGPFVPLNCAALPAELLESELFGFERGAFTGADRSRPGRFQQADGGTLFLDEIGDLPLRLQAKLLRVLDEGVVDRLGATKRTVVNVRVVAATNQDLRGEVRAGRYREDLFHRLGVVPLEMVPLRERPEDIELLARHFVAQQAEGGQVSLAPALIKVLMARPWPGNARELKNLVERMVLLRRSDVLDLADLALPGGAVAYEKASPPGPSADAQAAGPSHQANLLQPGDVVLPEESFSLPALEMEIVLKAIEKCSGNRSAAARYLGIPRHVLLYRLEKRDADRPPQKD